MNKDSIATLKEIGARLEQARKEQGIPLAQVIKQAGASRASWYYWAGGENEGGCRQIAIAAALLGLTPNQLLLADPDNPDETRTGVLDGHDFANLARIREHIAALTRLNKNPGVRPSAIVEESLRHTLAMFTSATIPAGTVIATPERGVKTMVPPPRDIAARLKRRGRPGPRPAAGGVAEAPAKYGRKKRA